MRIDNKVDAAAVLNYMKKHCAADKDLVEKDFNNHYKEILIGKHCPIGMKQQTYLFITHTYDGAYIKKIKEDLQNKKQINGVRK